MPSMTDPMDSLRLLQEAIDNQILQFQPGELYSDLAVHYDTPNDIPRFTYVKLNDLVAQSIALFVMVDPIDGIPCFQMGWATIPSMRGNGLATDISTKAVEELKNGLRRNSTTKFYLEAVISDSNTESRNIANKLLSDSPESCKDSFSGEDAFQYLRLIE